MPARKQLAITERQFEALSLLWEHGPLTVRELLDRMQGSRPLPYTTVLGLLQGMERAGLATHDVENQTHRYRATLTRREATGNLLSDFVARFFRGSAERLVLGLLDGEQLTPADLDQIKQQLDDSKPTEKPSSGKTSSARPKSRRPRS